MLEDQANGHGQVPPCHVSRVGHLELIGNVVVEHAEACPVYVDKGGVIVFGSLEDLVCHLHCSLGGEICILGVFARINYGYKGRSRFE